MQLVHPRRNVNYTRVVDALADSITELNRANTKCVAPALPTVPSFDVEGLIDDILSELDQRADSGAESAADAAADAAAEHSASSQEFVAFATVFTALSTALAVYGVARDAFSLYQMFQRRRRR
jgi:hypothetical protein